MYCTHHCSQQLIRLLPVFPGISSSSSHTQCPLTKAQLGARGLAAALILARQLLPLLLALPHLLHVTPNCPLSWLPSPQLPSPSMSPQSWP